MMTLTEQVVVVMDTGHILVFDDFFNPQYNCRLLTSVRCEVDNISCCTSWGDGLAVASPDGQVMSLSHLLAMPFQHPLSPYTHEQLPCTPIVMGALPGRYMCTEQ
ncbi:hypothetical protein KIPB_006710 [Kipferlia bialata]|uniref:Uncharacterized protein n=1 Tax=Kipferlia bialata TaxID=797122 RepID=A0A9K3GK04_9EUKA|nr:hypothetical protein KIPB_006710 [Kipferlia bialata]|eukprot:g6710.t1